MHKRLTILDRASDIRIAASNVRRVVNPSAVIVDAVRTPFGSHDSKLNAWHAVDLLTATFRAVIERSGLQPQDIDHVIAGCAVPVGEQAMNIARNAVVAAGWSESIPAHTVDAQGASGIMALHEAVARVKSGMSRVCLVGAVSSTRVPDGASTGVAVGKPFGSVVHDRFAEKGGLRSPGLIAEHLALTNGIGREQLDAYALRSLESNRSADETGAKKPYVVELRDSKKIPTVISTDERPRKRDITKLKPLFENDGLLTAATFALPVSGAVAILVASHEALTKQMQPLAEITACMSIGSEMLNGSIGVAIAKQTLRNVRNKPSLLEVQEDSAVTPVAFTQQSDYALDTINTMGGSLAVGNAFGVSGLASVVHLAHALSEQDATGLALSAGYDAISTATLLTIHTQ